MTISFTSSIIKRLTREIADLQKKSIDEKKKKEKALSKIKQLQIDIKKTTLPSDLSNKMTRVNKLNEEVAKITAIHAEVTKRLTNKKAELVQQQAKTEQRDN